MRRLPIEMKTSTYRRRSQTVSTVKKSQASIDSACACRKARQRLPAALRCRRQARDREHVADEARRDVDPELAQLTDDPLIAPARVLPGEAHDQLAYLMADRWPSGLAVGIRPLVSDQPAMPAQERLRPHEKDAPTAARQRAAQCCEQEPIVGFKPRLADLPAKDRQLVAQHENLELLLTIAAGDEHDQLQQAADKNIQG